jgi:hypothetical protein
MGQIEEMTRQIVAKTKGHESDTVPGDFGELKVALSQMRRRDQGELQKISVPKVRFRAVENRGGPAVGNSRKWRN